MITENLGGRIKKLKNEVGIIQENLHKKFGMDSGKRYDAIIYFEKLASTAVHKS